MDTPKLTPANENPWYVLMTLYGEQVGENFNNDLHRQNREVWNAWSCKGLDDVSAVNVAKQARIKVDETRGWEDIAKKVMRKHRVEMKKRHNGEGYTYPGFPDFKEFVNCSCTLFSEELVLRNFVFTRRSYFSSVTFKLASDFTSAVFAQGADFAHTIFMSAVDFYYVTFSQFVSFQSATFTQLAYFASATFNGPAKFVGARFGLLDGGEVCLPIFTEAAFARVLSFREAEFVSHYPVLEGAEFGGAVVVTAKPANWPEVELQLLEEAEKSSKVPTKEVAKDSCATLRHALGKQGRPEEEHFFFKREMTLAGQIGSLPARLPYQLFGWVSDYGHSIARPTNILLALWVGLVLVYTEGAGLGALEALGYSFANMFKFFGLQRTYFDFAEIRDWPAWVQVVSAIQTVLSFILLFFLGLGLRTRFRLR